MTEKYKPIPHRLKNMAVGGHVAGAVDIYDDEIGKNQQDINQEYGASISALSGQNYVTVEADEQTSDVTEVLPQVGSDDTVYRVANWDGEQYDPTSFSQYAWNDGSYKFLNNYKPGIDSEATLGSKNLIESNAVKSGDMTNILPSDSMFDSNSVTTESSVGEWQIRYPEDDSVVNNSSYMTISLDGNTESAPRHAIWIPGLLTAYTECDVVVEFDAKGTDGDILRICIGPADENTQYINITDEWKHYTFVFEGITGSGANLGRVNLFNNTEDSIEFDIKNMRVKVNNEDIIRRLSDYQYMGVALPDDSAPKIEPGKKYFWFANKGGTYTNYGGITVDFAQRAIILYNGTTWVKNTITGKDQNPYTWLLSIRSDGYIFIEDGYLHWKGLYFERAYDGVHVHLTDGTHGWLVDNSISTEDNVLLYFEPDEISDYDAVVESSAFAASIGNIVPLGSINDQRELDTSSIFGKALTSYKERSLSATEKRRLDLTIGGIQVSDNTSEEYGEFDYINEYGKRMWCTPRFIKVVSPKITLYGDQFFEVSVVRYDKDFKTISNSTAKGSDENNEVELQIETYSAGSSSPVKYIRLYFQKRIGGVRQYFKPTIYAEGIGDDVFAKIQDTSLLRFSYDNTYHTREQFPKMVYTDGMEDYPWLPLSIPVNYTNPYSSDGNQTVVKDSENYVYDYGFLALPATYSNTGKPTRLIIFCHGSSMHYTKGCKNINTGRMGADPAYWLSEGYAVMDMEGSPFGYESGTTRYPHDNIPQSIECYRAGYEFVIKAFNICRDGVFIGGRSLGAGMATSLINSSGIPVLAAVLNAPTRVCEISFFKSRVAARRAYEAYYKGFSKTGTLSDDATWWGTGTLNQTKLDFLTSHKEKILMYSSYTRLIQNFPAWSDYIALANGDTFNSEADKNAVLAAYANSLIKSDIPIKIFASPSDNVVDQRVGAELLYKMTCAGGTISELRMFPAHDDQSDPYAGEPIDTGHPFDLYYGNRVATYTNTRGLALEDVPIAYIEALQFWRRFENNLG